MLHFVWVNPGLGESGRTQSWETIGQYLHLHVAEEMRTELEEIFIAETDATLGGPETHRGGVVGAVDADTVAGTQTDEPRAVSMGNVTQAVAEIMAPLAGIDYLGDAEGALWGTEVARFLFLAITSATRNRKKEEGISLIQQTDSHAVLVYEESVLAHSRQGSTEP